MTEPRSSRTDAGFSLVEILVTMAVASLLIVSILAVFDFNNRLTHVQTNITDMQQSLRASQYLLVRQIRMAGRGGLPQNVAMGVRDNAGLTGAQQTVLVGKSSPNVVRGTDVVTVRGVFATPVYQVNYNDDASFIPPVGFGDGKLVLTNPGPTGVPQDLSPFKQIQNGFPEALLLVSPTSDSQYAVVEISSVDATDTSATINFHWTGGTHADDYKKLYGNPATFPLSRVGAAGILEEYRYYVQDVAASAPSVAASPKLSMARVFPGTEVEYTPGSLKIDVADDILDLQAVLGYDLNGDGEVTGAPNPPATDEWLYNDKNDDPTPFTAGTLAYIRLSTLARTDRADPKYLAPPLAPLEDHDYDNPPTDLNSLTKPDRRYRRRLLQTVVDLRNLG
jgi:prepilin-type N-terminal cleavage/methylation domain-containing protein